MMFPSEGDRQMGIDAATTPSEQEAGHQIHSADSGEPPLRPTDREEIDRTAMPSISESKDEDGEPERTTTLDMHLTQQQSLEQNVSLPRELLIVAIIVLSQFTTQVSFGGTLVILHVIARSFGIENPGIESWLVAGYSLTVGTFILVFGRMGDVFGYKMMLVIGYLWFAVWSIVAGLAVYSNYVLFVFARVLQGIGPAICLPNGLALLGAIYSPGPRKNMAFAVFGACAPGGCLIGAAFSSIFAEFAWWPWAYWTFGMVLAVIAGGGAGLLPKPQTSLKMPRSVKAFINELDLIAGAVGITSLVLINFAWNQAPIVGWHSAYVCVCLVLGVILMPVFFYLEIKVSPFPLIPFSVFNSTNAFVLSCIACGWGNFGIWSLYLFSTLEVLRGTSPLLVSAYLSPLVLFGIVAAVATGFLLSRVCPAWLMLLAMAMFLAGDVLVATLPPHQTYWAQIFVTTLVSPFGMDASFPAATIYLSDAIEKERQGVAASLVNTIVNYSISLALGFAGTVEVHVNHGGHDFADILQGYRGALYVGTGLSGLGLALSVIFVCKTYIDDRKTAVKPGDVEKSESRDADRDLE